MGWIHNEAKAARLRHKCVLPNPDEAGIRSVYQCDGCKTYYVCIPPGDYYSNQWIQLMPWHFAAKKKIKEYESD